MVTGSKFCFDRPHKLLFKILSYLFILVVWAFITAHRFLVAA